MCHTQKNTREASSICVIVMLGETNGIKWHVCYWHLVNNGRSKPLVKRYMHKHWTVGSDEKILLL